MKTCRQCGTVFEDGYGFCPECGTRYTAEEPETEVLDGSLCPRCGAAIPDDYLFCPTCGVKVREAPVQRQAGPGWNQTQEDRRPPERASGWSAPGREPGHASAQEHGHAPEPEANWSTPEQGTSRSFQEQEPGRHAPEPEANWSTPEQGPSRSFQEQEPGRSAAAQAAWGAGPEDLPDAEAVPVAPKKKRSGRKALIVCGVIAAVIVIAVAFANYTSPRYMTINSDRDIEVYVGDEYQIPVTAEGLSESDLQGIVWTSDDDRLVKVENGILTAAYDKNAFDAATADTEEGEGGECTYTSYIYGHLEQGLKKWDGTARVVVSLKPVEFESGKLIKEPADSRDSYIEITGAEDFSTYFYFESKDKSANDLSFLLKAGDTVKVDVPCDTYTIYEACGDTWYGTDMLFGPKTFYTKDGGEYDFTPSTYWTLKQGVENGNTSADSIESEDFPE